MMRKHGMMGLGSITTADDRGVATERLQLLAKKASLLHTDSGVPMTDAVTRTLNGEQGLNEEHVRRVTEMANNYGFATLFKRAAGHKVINFDGGPADPSSVVQELRSTGTAPIVEKCASVLPEERYAPGIDSFMARASLSSPKEKIAARANTSELCKLANDLLHAKEWIGTELVGLRVRLDDAARALHKEAMALVRAGHSPAEISKIAAERFEPDLARFTLRTIYSLGGWDELEARPISKEATAWVNPKHPLVQKLDHFVKTALDHFATLRAYELVVEEHEKASTVLREALR